MFASGSRGRYSRCCARPGRRDLAVKLAATSRQDDPVDAASLDGKALGDLLEASDLTPDPAEALERLLTTLPASATSTDLVLLTHPRSLAAPRVVTAARAIVEQAGFATVQRDHRCRRPARAGRAQTWLTRRIRAESNSVSRSRSGKFRRRAGFQAATRWIELRGRERSSRSGSRS